MSLALPPVEATDDEVRAWVRSAVAALDTTPRVANWRYRALGMNYGEAMADAPMHARISLKVPLGEARIVRDVARDRGLSREGYVKRALGTFMAAVDEVDPDSLPFLLSEGLLR